jgi:alpha-1,6-mannosyltransferase
MASGTPVAAVAGGAVGELVTADTGALGDGVDGLARAIATLFEGDRTAQRVAARRRAEEFSWQRSVDAMLGLHGAVARSRRLAAAG